VTVALDKAQVIPRQSANTYKKLMRAQDTAIHVIVRKVESL
jgi:hypothetical protein